MKFSINSVTKCSGRIGNFIKNDGKSFPTPMLLVSTKGGSFPFLSKEVIDMTFAEENLGLIFPFNNMDHMENALSVSNKSAVDYCGHNTSGVDLVQVKDPTEMAPSGFHEKDTVPVFTRRGKIFVTTKTYMDFVESANPSMFVALCDGDTNFESSRKRCIKAADRTWEFLNECVKRQKNSPKLTNSNLVASVQGGYDMKVRANAIKNLTKVPEIKGFFLDGFHNNGDTACNVPITDVKSIVSYCCTSLPEQKFKIMSGAYTPSMIIHLVMLGVDIFDSSFPYIATVKNSAITFNFHIDNETKENSFLKLDDKRFAKDFSPLLKDCSCLSCEKHTRAYIHHLINTKELLGPILLMIHNTHHYIEFFKMIRSLQTNDSLPKLRDLLESQKFID